MTCMRVSDDGIKQLHDREACRLKAYLDSAKIPTIGWGTIRYPDGRKVKMGDVITQAQADDYFRFDLRAIEEAVDALTVDTITQRQFDSLCSLTYNIGIGGYSGSTVRRLVNADPQDPNIRKWFMVWCRAQLDADPYKERVAGLWNRRHAEADQYFGVITPRPAFPGP